jgi:hypothetical protein
MKNEYEKQNNFTYDIVFRYRPDMCLVEKIPEKHINKIDDNTIYTLNPPKIYYPNRVYDIFFYGSSKSMNILVEKAWLDIITYIFDSFDNGLPVVDSCRILYLGCIRNSLKVNEIDRCIGDIYRDEPMNEYVNKILYKFN